MIELILLIISWVVSGSLGYLYWKQRKEIKVWQDRLRKAETRLVAWNKLGCDVVTAHSTLQVIRNLTK